MRTLVLLSALLFLTTGCAKYEFDLVEPPELRTRIARKAMTGVKVDPLVYHLQAVEGRLVMLVENPTDQQVQLVGDQSWVVDGDGISHPLPTRTIAPASRIKLIFPPLRPRIERVSPTFGVGVGVGVSDTRRYGRHEFYGVHDPWDDYPVYVTVFDGITADMYWDWKGETSARVSLFYRHGDADTAGEGGRTFRHEFTFQRRKVS